jgi:hypothetical protein
MITHRDEQIQDKDCFFYSNLQLTFIREKGLFMMWEPIFSVKNKKDSIRRVKNRCHAVAYSKRFDTTITNTSIQSAYRK